MMGKMLTGSFIRANTNMSVKVFLTKRFTSVCLKVETGLLIKAVVRNRLPRNLLIKTEIFRKKRPGQPSLNTRLGKKKIGKKGSKHDSRDLRLVEMAEAKFKTKYVSSLFAAQEAYIKNPNLQIREGSDWISSVFQKEAVESLVKNFYPQSYYSQMADSKPGGKEIGDSNGKFHACKHFIECVLHHFVLF